MVSAVCTTYYIDASCYPFPDLVVLCKFLKMHILRGGLKFHHQLGSSSTHMILQLTSSWRG